MSGGSQSPGRLPYTSVNYPGSEFSIWGDVRPPADLRPPRGSEWSKRDEKRVRSVIEVEHVLVRY